MTTVSHEPVLARPQWAEFLRIREMWAAVAIIAMWLAVLFDGIFGPDIVGNDGTRFPSAVAIALFALIGTTTVARFGFRRDA